MEFVLFQIHQTGSTCQWRCHPYAGNTLQMRVVVGILDYHLHQYYGPRIGSTAAGAYHISLWVW